MNWYKKAQLTQDERVPYYDRKTPQFTPQFTKEYYVRYPEWFKSINVDHSILNKYNLYADDIYRHYKELKFPSNTSFEDACKITRKHIDNKEQNKINKQIDKDKDKDNKHEELKRQYEGKKCNLNGYPAIIQSNSYGYPEIQNTEGQKTNWYRNVSWNSISKHFPNFAGGLYTFKDTLEDIQDKLAREQSRAFYLGQQAVLKILKRRIMELKSKSGQYKGFGKYYPFVDN